MAKGIITYRRNPYYRENGSGNLPRLFAELDLSDFGIDHKIKNLPVYYQRLTKPAGAIRVIYRTRIAGLEFEAGNLNKLEKMIGDTARILIRFESLPEYFFQVNNCAYPIYNLGNELLTRYPGGPVFNGDDIPGLRIWLADHFKAIGRIQHRREMGLLYLSINNLQLYAPICVMRVPGEKIPDIPVFPAPDGNTWEILAPFDGLRIKKSFDTASAILDIREQLEEILLINGLIDNRSDLMIRKLSLDTWRMIEPDLTVDPHQLVYMRKREGELTRQVLQVFRRDQILMAPRTNRIQNVVIYTGSSIEELARHTGEDLAYYGTIDHADQVQVVQDEENLDREKSMLEAST